MRSSDLLRFGAFRLCSTDPDPLPGQSLEEVSSSIADRCRHADCARRLNNVDAFAALRAHPYGHSESVDGVAEDFTRKRLHPEDLLD